MARSVLAALCEFDARLFAAVIPRDVIKPDTSDPEYLRKDHVFLLERYFYFLERQRAHGLLVLDAVSKGTDQRLGRQIEGYFSKTYTGRCRTAWIVPMPMFVTSDLAIPIQAADLAIYCVNWGFRLPDQGMGAPIRDDIAAEFGPSLNQLQYRGHGYRNGRVFDSYGTSATVTCTSQSSTEHDGS